MSFVSGPFLDYVFAHANSTTSTFVHDQANKINAKKFQFNQNQITVQIGKIHSVETLLFIKIFSVM